MCGLRSIIDSMQSENELAEQLNRIARAHIKWNVQRKHVFVGFKSILKLNTNTLAKLRVGKLFYHLSKPKLKKGKEGVLSIFNSVYLPAGRKLVFFWNFILEHAWTRFGYGERNEWESIGWWDESGLERALRSHFQPYRSLSP